MKGFKDFLMRGNLVELAVAFIIGGAFAKVVEAFTAIILDIVGKVGASTRSVPPASPASTSAHS